MASGRRALEGGLDAGEHLGGFLTHRGDTQDRSGRLGARWFSRNFHVVVRTMLGSVGFIWRARIGWQGQEVIGHQVGGDGGWQGVSGTGWQGSRKSSSCQGGDGRRHAVRARGMFDNARLGLE